MTQRTGRVYGECRFTSRLRIENAVEVDVPGPVCHCSRPPIFHSEHARNCMDGCKQEARHVFRERGLKSSLGHGDCFFHATLPVKVQLHLLPSSWWTRSQREPLMKREFVSALLHRSTEFASASHIGCIETGSQRICHFVKATRNISTQRTRKVFSHGLVA